MPGWARIISNLTPLKQSILFAQSLWSSDWWQSILGPRPKSTVRNLGVLIDDRLSMSDHVNSITRVCYGLMRSLRKVFKWIPLSSRMPLVQGLIISRLDYGNALLASINEEHLTKLQVLQNTAAKLVLNLTPSLPSAPSLSALHWLPIRKRINFKIGCLVHKTLIGQGPKNWDDISPLELYDPPTITC